MSDSTSAENFTEQMASFQKIWMETFSRMTQNAFAFTPDSAPPEMLRQMRSGIFQALSQSWDEYLRSPQFREGMKQMMDGAIFFKKMTNDLLTKARHETQDVAREDIDSVLLAVRHMENRILVRMEELSARIDLLNPSKANGAVESATTPAAAASKRAPRTGSQLRNRKTPRAKQEKNEP